MAGDLRRYVSAFKLKNKLVYQHEKEISQKEFASFVCSLYSVNAPPLPTKKKNNKNLPDSKYKMQCVLALALVS